MKGLHLKSNLIASFPLVVVSLLAFQCKAFPLTKLQNAGTHRLSHYVPMKTADRLCVKLSSNIIPRGNFGRDHINMHSVGSQLFVRDEKFIDTVDENDYLVLDSLDLPDAERPSFVEAIQNPRDALALLLLVPLGGSVSVCNILGIYSDRYDYLVEASAYLGMLSGMAAFLQIATSYKVTNHSRRLLVNDSAVNVYAALYALAVSWLALRTGNQCPEWLADDANTFALALPWISTAIFVGSALVPLATLLNPGNSLKNTPALTDTELLRARGLLAIGILASVFAPDCLAFGLGGSEWWNRVSILHSSQRTLESSTSLFALFANEASMVAHRCGREGVAPFSVLVPAFAAVCLLLAIFPCIAALHWLGSDVSFFSFYRA